MTNTLVVIGAIGMKRAYLNVNRAEALRRFKEADGEYGSDIVYEIEFDDEFGVYEAWERREGLPPGPPPPPTAMRRVPLFVSPMNTIVAHLVAMGVTASVYDSGGNIECVRVDDGEGRVWLFGTADDNWGGSLHHDDYLLENDEYLETDCSTDETDLFKVAQAINRAINPDSGRR